MTKRENIAHLINSTPDETAATYELLGLGIKDLTMNYNPTTESEHYVHQKNANTQVTGYAPTMAAEMTVKPGDDAFDYIDSLRQAGPATFEDAETDIVEVRKYETPDGTSYPATKWPCAIQIDSGPGGAGGESAKISFTINITGDAIDGDFDISTLAFTPTT